MEPTPTTGVDATDPSSLLRRYANERVLSKQKHQQNLQVSYPQGDGLKQVGESSSSKQKRKRKEKEMVTGCADLKTIRSYIVSLDLSVEELTLIREETIIGETPCPSDGEQGQRKKQRVGEKGYEVYSKQADAEVEVANRNLDILNEVLSNSSKVVQDMIETENTENVILNYQKQEMIMKLQIQGHNNTGSSGIILSDGLQQSTLTTSEGNHNSVTMPQLRGHQQVHRGGLGPTPATSFGFTASSSKSTMPANEGFQSMQRRHGNFQGLGSQYHTGTGTESDNLPLNNAYNAPAPTPVMNPGVQQGSLSSATPQVANTAFGATSFVPAIMPSEDYGGMPGPRETLEFQGNHNSVCMPHLRGQQQVHRGDLGPTPANSFGVTASSSNSTIRGNVGFHSMQRQQGNFQGLDTGMAYYGKTTTTNNQESFRNQIVEIDNKITNAFPFTKQWIEQRSNNNQQVQQGSLSSAIPQDDNTAFGATSSAQAEISASENHEGMPGPRGTFEGNHNSVCMPHLRGQQQVHRGGFGPTPANSFGVTASSSNSMMGGHEGFQSMHGNFQVQQGNHSAAIPQVANTAFAATSSAPAVIPPSDDRGGIAGGCTHELDLKLRREYSNDEVNELFSIEELLPQFSEFERNQTPNTSIGAPDFTSEGDSDWTE